MSDPIVAVSQRNCDPMEDELVRVLRFQNSVLVEEVRQLQAALSIYREVVRLLQTAKRAA